MLKKKKSPAHGPKSRHKVIVTKDGPYLVFGRVPLAKEIIVVDRDRIPVRWGKGGRYPLQEAYALCRCGHSSNKPYCDGTHAKIRFVGTEVAGNKRYITQAEKIIGRDLVVTDVAKLCASARFCHRAGGIRSLTEDSDDPKAKRTAIQEACDCPSGRLVAWGKLTRKPIEPELKPSLGLVEDPDNGLSGPIRVKGRIPVESSKGIPYEVRNRCTLCRCGKSANKPFCDSTHLSVGFTDGDASLRKSKKRALTHL